MTGVVVTIYWLFTSATFAEQVTAFALEDQA
jgi:hypothetical protein